MTTSAYTDSRSTAAATRSWLSISATVTLAAITHAYDFGAAALVAGAMLLVMLFVLNRQYRQAGSRWAAALYGLLGLWVIIGFGLVGGAWNHAVRDVLVVTHGGTLPLEFEPLFMSPEVGGAFYETGWILLGAAGMVASYFWYRFARAVPWIPRRRAVERSTIA